MKSMGLLSALILFITCKQAPESHNTSANEAQRVSSGESTGSLPVNTASSSVEWIATKVSGYHTGIVKIKSGEMKVNGTELVGGKFILDMTSIDVTGPKGSNPAMNKKLAGHLHTADFFETDKFPEAVFEITSVTKYAGTPVTEPDDPRQQEISEYKVAAPSHIIKGNLTIKGITKNIEFPAEVSVSQNSVNAMAKFNIDRKQWGITYPGQPDDLIRDEVYFGISIVAGG